MSTSSIETAFFERMSNQLREEQNRCPREIERHQNADKSYKDEGIALLDLASQRSTARQPAFRLAAGFADLGFLVAFAGFSAGVRWPPLILARSASIRL